MNTWICSTCGMCLRHLQDAGPPSVRGAPDGTSVSVGEHESRFSFGRVYGPDVSSAQVYTDVNELVSGYTHIYMHAHTQSHVCMLCVHISLYSHTHAQRSTHTDDRGTFDSEVCVRVRVCVCVALQVQSSLDGYQVCLMSYGQTGVCLPLVTSQVNCWYSVEDAMKHPHTYVHMHVPLHIYVLLFFGMCVCVCVCRLREDLQYAGHSATAGHHTPGAE